MAVVTGTSSGDFIHRFGGCFNPGGMNEVTGVTTGADQITGDVGSDVIYGDAGNDTMDGGDGSDALAGGQGADRLLGGVGNDIFRIIQQSDISGLAETVNGGNDVDTLDFQTFRAVGAIDLTTVTLVSVETLLMFSNDMALISAQLDGFSAIGAADPVRWWSGRSDRGHSVRL